MARMSGNENFSSIYFGDSSQLNSLVLDSGEKCYMTTQIFDLIPGSLEDTDNYIGVAGGHYLTAKQKGKVRIRMCEENRYPLISTLKSVLLSLDLCNRLF